MALVAIALWAIMPVGIATATAELPALTVAFGVNATAAAFLLLFLLTHALNPVTLVRELRATSSPRALRGLAINLAGAIAVRSAAHIALFSALKGGDRIFAVIFYEMYPLFLIGLSMFGPLSVKQHRRRAGRGLTMALAVLCFVALFIGYLGADVTRDHSLTGITLLGGLAGLCNAVDNLLHRRARRFIVAHLRARDRAHETRQSMPVTARALRLSGAHWRSLRSVAVSDFSTRLASAILLGLAAATLGASPAGASPTAVIMVVVVGFLTYGLATTLWQFTIQTARDPSVFLLWYVTPLGSLALLNLTNLGDISNVSAFAALAILLINQGALLRNEDYAPPLALDLVLAVAVFGFAFLFVEPMATRANATSFIELGGAVLGILAGFHIAHLTQRNADSNQRRLRLLSRLAREAPEGATDGIHERIARDIVLLDNTLTDQGRRAALGQLVSQLNCRDAADSEDGLCEETRAEVLDWASQRTVTPTGYETIILWGLTLMVALGLVVTRPIGAVSDILGFLVSVGATSLLFLIKNLERHQPDTFFRDLVVLQAPLFRRFGYYVVPRRLGGRLEELGLRSRRQRPAASINAPHDKQGPPATVHTAHIELRRSNPSIASADDRGNLILYGLALTGIAAFAFAVLAKHGVLGDTALLGLLGELLPR